MRSIRRNWRDCIRSRLLALRPIPSTSSNRPKARQSGLRSGQRLILLNGLRSWLRRFLFRRASRDRDSACHCSLNLLAQFSLGRPRIGVYNRAAHLLARPVGFGSLGHQKALPPSFLLLSGLLRAQHCMPASQPLEIEATEQRRSGAASRQRWPCWSSRSCLLTSPCASDPALTSYAFASPINQ